MPHTSDVSSALRIKLAEQGTTSVHGALLPCLNLPHHLIDLIARINLTALTRQLRKTAPLWQQTALR